jgi:toxin secretion/phage lysis holin
MLIALLVLLSLDLFVGIGAAIINKQFSSKELINGIIKKIIILCMVAAAYWLDNVFCLESPFIRSGAIIAFIIAESGSLFKNADRAGVTIPPFIINILAEVKPEDYLKPGPKKTL